MKSNEQLQKDVQDAIKWEPLLNVAEIGVTAHNGVVTLTGTIDSYTKKLEAESAAKNVAGVKALVENIKVEFGSWGRRSDTDIANEVLAGLKQSRDIPADKIKIEVEDGGVTLSGEVPWNYQKEAAKTAADNQEGVKWVKNHITIAPESTDRVEQQSIEDALARNSSVDEGEIRVSVTNNNVTLRGTVNSWHQRGEAERTAWKTPGVCAVNNELVIAYNYN